MKQQAHPGADTFHFHCWLVIPVHGVNDTDSNARAVLTTAWARRLMRKAQVVADREISLGGGSKPNPNRC